MHIMQMIYGLCCLFICNFCPAVAIGVNGYIFSMKGIYLIQFTLNKYQCTHHLHTSIYPLWSLERCILLRSLETSNRLQIAAPICRTEEILYSCSPGTSSWENMLDYAIFLDKSWFKDVSEYGVILSCKIEEKSMNVLSERMTSVCQPK